MTFGIRHDPTLAETGIQASITGAAQRISHASFPRDVVTKCVDSGRPLWIFENIYGAVGISEDTRLHRPGLYCFAAQLPVSLPNGAVGNANREATCPPRQS